MSPKALILATAVLMLTLGGCASRKEITRFQQDAQYIRQQLDEIRAENTVIQKQLDQIEKAVTTARDENRRTRADLMAEISSLKNHTAFLDSKLEDTSSRMRNLLRRVEDRPIEEAADTTQAQVAPAEPIDPASSKMYDLARLDFSRGHYDLALTGFREFLRQFPQSEFAVDAQFWIAEILYVNGDFAGALEEFQNVILNFPTGLKTAAALLKIGYCFAELEELHNATRHLEAVIKQFPGSQEANVAQEKLNQIQIESTTKPQSSRPEN